MAAAVGFPVMLKASWGGGGRGMRIVEDDRELIETVAAARREAKAAFGKDEVYLEKLIRRARHVEVQILGDSHGNLVHLYERDCTVQRRNQKVVERAPAAFLTEAQRSSLCEAALKIGRAVGYRAAGTVEFLQDADTGKFYFIEVNPRIQVEHTVTECVTGIDLVKAQIRIAAGARIGTPESGVPRQEDIRVNAHALQCRVTTEDPENNFVPDYGTVTAYRSPAGFGIRLDAGTAYAGAIITRFYDSLLVKVTAWSPTPEETIARMHRALWEFRIRGVVTNLRFLDQLIMHPRFASADYTTKFIDQTPELFRSPRKRDRATRLLSFIGDVIVNGNPEVKGRARPKQAVFPRLPRIALPPPPDGTKQRLDELGPGEVRRLDAAGAPRPLDRHQHARRASVAAGHAFPHPRHGADRAVLRRPAAAAVFGGVLGRRDFRRRHAFPARGSLGAARRVSRSHAQSAAADAVSLGQCGRLHQLSRQCREAFRRARGRGRHRCIPGVRLLELGRQHAGRDRSRARYRPAVRGGDLLHGESDQSAGDQVRPEVLRQAGQGIARPWARTCWRSRTWGACASRAPPRRWSRRSRKKWVCRFIFIPTTPAESRRPACSPRSRPASTRWTARSMPCPA